MSARLDQLQPQASVLHLQLDCATRWNSTVDMLTRFLRLLPFIERLRAQARVGEAPQEILQAVVLTDDEVIKLQQAQQVLLCVCLF